MCYTCFSHYQPLNSYLHFFFSHCNNSTLPFQNGLRHKQEHDADMRDVCVWCIEKKGNKYRHAHAHRRSKDKLFNEQTLTMNRVTALANSFHLTLLLMWKLWNKMVSTWNKVVHWLCICSYNNVRIMRMCLVLFFSFSWKHIISSILLLWSPTHRHHNHHHHHWKPIYMCMMEWYAFTFTVSTWNHQS